MTNTTEAETGAWYIRLSNGREVHFLPQSGRKEAEEAARLCRLAAPDVRVVVICVPVR